jgi:hypothetical protein
VRRRSASRRQDAVHTSLQASQKLVPARSIRARHAWVRRSRVRIETSSLMNVDVFGQKKSGLGELLHE